MSMRKMAKNGGLHSTMRYYIRSAKIYRCFRFRLKELLWESLSHASVLYGGTPRGSAEGERGEGRRRVQDVSINLPPIVFSLLQVFAPYVLGRQGVRRPGVKLEGV